MTACFLECILLAEFRNGREHRYSQQRLHVFLALDAVVKIFKQEGDGDPEH
ncbi:hypothetical protein D3C85_1841390 [compost metagenome]